MDNIDNISDIKYNNISNFLKNRHNNSDYTIYFCNQRIYKHKHKFKKNKNKNKKIYNP